MRLRLKALGITIVPVEHDTRLVVSDHVAVLDSGRVICQGPPAHVQPDPQVVAAYLVQPKTAAD